MDDTAIETIDQKRLKNRRRFAWAVLLILTLTVLFSVIIPVVLIMPFRSQSQGGLALAYSLRRWSPSLTLIVAAVSLAVVIWLWRGTRWWIKPALVIALMLTFTATWFARQNHFEWMFNPLPNAGYAKTSEAHFMTDSDMVLAVEHQGEAVAYPIRLMAYHHLVQDTVGGTPLVATY
jgi:glucan phosphoethanolaminetransferase (alkaline phosphatase superfamily)